MLDRFRPGELLLGPLKVISRNDTDASVSNRCDAVIDVGWMGKDAQFQFVVEVKSQSHTQAFENAVTRAKAAAGPDLHPMIILPYLSPARLDELDSMAVSGVDLCGNGLVSVPGEWHVNHRGQPNRYPDSRPLSNPYRGRSAMVARMLLSRRRWESLSDLRAAVVAAGCGLSLSQVSKAVQALVEDGQIARTHDAIILRSPVGLSDELQREWSRQPAPNRFPLRLPAGTDVAAKLSADPKLRWAVTGESSVHRYATFAQGGPVRVAVSNRVLATGLLDGKPEMVPNFAAVELWETEEAGYYFDPVTDEQGMRWASLLQTWLELRAGDARQREAAEDLRGRIFKGA